MSEPGTPSNLERVPGTTFRLRCRALSCGVPGVPAVPVKKCALGARVRACVRARVHACARKTRICAWNTWNTWNRYELNDLSNHNHSINSRGPRSRWVFQVGQLFQVFHA